MKKRIISLEKVVPGVFLLSLSLVTSPGYGQTSGPSAPEVQKFTPNHATELVNLFTGDLNYNISILELDSGYPINLSYSSVLNMTEEASGVGFGWQLNIGRISRTLRGLPDDFHGDLIHKEMNQSPDWSLGLGAGLDAEIFGSKFLRGNLSGGISFSKLRGIDVEASLGASISKKIGKFEVSGGLNLAYGTNEGSSILPNAGLSYNNHKLAVSTKINSMQGMRYLSLNLRNQNVGQLGNGLNFPLMSASVPFTPRIDFQTRNVSGSFTYRFGGMIWGVSAGLHVYGQFSMQKLAENSRDLSGYGYFHLEESRLSGCVMDVASEKEGPVFEEDPNLYLTYLTPDVYAVSAQGLSGTYRPFRTDVGVAYYETLSSHDGGGSLGIESHEGGLLHSGIDIQPNIVSSVSGKWNSPAFSRWKFQKGKEGRPSFYFKNTGESNGFASKSQFDLLGGFDPVLFDIGPSSVSGTISGNPVNADAVLRIPEPRNFDFQYLTADLATQASKKLISYSDHGKNRKKTVLDRRGNYRKGDHLSYITVTKDDGTIYEFGIPAYNVTQTECTFAIEGKDMDHVFDKTTGFDPTNATVKNDKGANHFFSSTTTPGYAYAFLLTGVFSADYVDLTQDGPTVDDLGTYTKFNYTLEYDNFRWRTPYSGANYNAGNLCDKMDDIANFISGEKEIWTIHSIETKNFIAEFYTSSRTDANEPPDAVKSSRRLSRIDSVGLFSKLDTLHTLKTVHFNYDESLSPGIPASSVNGGKLTLRGLHFQYDNSNKEKHSFYQLNYTDDKNGAVNYDESLIDRWGTYKPVVDATLNNVRFPYSDQDKVRADKASQAWHLNSIKLPAGGRIDIEYEAKDYAFVQNKAAMQMYKIVGFSLDGSNPGPTIFTKSLASTKPLTKSVHNLYLVVDLGRTVDTTDLPKYFKGATSLYINCIVSVGVSNDALTNDLEEVSGYFDIDTSKTAIAGSRSMIIKLKEVNGTNPIARALWQKMRKSMNHILNPASISWNSNVEDNVVSMVKTVPRVLAGLVSYFDSYENTMTSAGRGESLKQEYGSFVRLYNPDGRKIGGGSRVKRIAIHDNWGKMNEAGADSATYGQEFIYEKVIDTDTISSGVATYEPIGNEENPFVVSSGVFESSGFLAPELYYNKTEPYGESLFPSPSIGYSLVKVKNLSYPGVTKNAIGVEWNEFYTAQDFPTIIKRTIKQGIPQTNERIVSYQKKFTASQGFYVELNDMHGKIKSHKVFSALDPSSPVSGTEYHYKTLNGSLDNRARTINSSTGEIRPDQWIGLDYEFNAFSCLSSTYTFTPNMQLNLGLLPFFVPIPVILVLPTRSSSIIQFAGVTTTKVVYRSGLIDEVIAFDHGTVIKTRNVLYDWTSGAPVVTATQNEFGKDVYSTKLPAYWFYPGMGFSNSGLVVDNYQSTNIRNDPRFNGGDELLLFDARTQFKSWVFTNSNGEKSILDEAGNIVSGTYNIRVLRSGKRNMQSIPAVEFTSLIDPSTRDKLLYDQVVDARATEFDQHWQGYFGVRPKIAKLLCDCNYLDLPPSIQVDIGCDRMSKGLGVVISGVKIKGKEFDVDILLEGSLANLKCDTTRYRLTVSHLKVIRQPGFCNSSYQVEGDYVVTDRHGESLRKGKCTIKSSRPVLACTQRLEAVPDPINCNIGYDVPVNPYVLGILGNWRPKATYKYQTDRRYDSPGPNQQGIYKEFNLFQEPFSLHAGKSDNWHSANLTAVYDPHGNPIESLNALMIPSAQSLGYGFNLSVAAAPNAHYYEIGSEGFEDHDFLKRVDSKFQTCSLPAHFNFEPIVGSDMITDSVSHTGKRSLLIQKYKKAALEMSVAEQCQYPFERESYVLGQYFLKKCDIVQPLSPVAGKKYLLSLWMSCARDVDNYDDPIGSVIISFLNDKSLTTASNEFFPDGSIVDGWQQIKAYFEVPVSTVKTKIEVIAKSKKICVDDIRMHPYNSNMKSFVYDHNKLRLMAVLDEENYATFYEYDGEGQLSRIKKETERGIVTVKEVHSAKPKTKILFGK